MNIKRFFASSSREALAMVRKSLGEDAVILSNRAVNGGNEILAFKEEDMASFMSDDTPVQSSKRRAAPAMEPLQAAQARPAARQARPPVRQAAPEAEPYRAVRTEPAPTTTARPKVTTTPAQAAAPQSNKQINDMLNEIRNMRSVIESQLVEISWGNIQHRDPVKSNTLNMLLSAGFSAALSRQIAENMPDHRTSAEANTWVQSILEKNLQAIPNEDEILNRGGVFALIGPTGVGKTTTTAKLAARFVMKHGPGKLGLITTDAYRIGGHEQLRIYGKILGVMVHAVKDEADLKIALEELKGKHTILIDTVGVSQKDRMVAEQIAMLSSTRQPIKKLLCLNATNTGETLTDVVRAYKVKQLDGCIITKLDEAATIGSALDVIIREKLRLYYVANGQRVPEDLHVANKKLLIHRAFRAGAQNTSSFQFKHNELPFLMGNTSPVATKLSMGADHV
ncbi:MULTISPECIES: flagellar biosynthesis protein FlhF [Methylovorus]|uniref:flagellar biosynthesis protein FlhF n=1 Tax=Methylovorus TaxID=81682 RepID=UPI0001EC450B|nr:MULTISPECIES: flagellar biosynthesis protein FlhF [Methylovorus]ADQ84009.1 GTP-binding signal recognition particle SRP54 G- domain protein [Methylovorus sp. MP688]KAF0844619.1 flagellar biosynthesis protein FlhF [Methylovorus glucosotrophus]